MVVPALRLSRPRRTRDLVARAAAAGASALVVTVDTPVLGRREADERNRFALPAGVMMPRSCRHRLPAATGSRAEWTTPFSWSRP